jgi:hypothetical protein
VDDPEDVEIAGDQRSQELAEARRHADWLLLLVILEQDRGVSPSPIRRKPTSFSSPMAVPSSRSSIRWIASALGHQNKQASRENRRGACTAPGGRGWCELGRGDGGERRAPAVASGILGPPEPGDRRGHIPAGGLQRRAAVREAGIDGLAHGAELVERRHQ